MSPFVTLTTLCTFAPCSKPGGVRLIWRKVTTVCVGEVCSRSWTWSWRRFSPRSRLSVLCNVDRRLFILGLCLRLQASHLSPPRPHATRCSVCGVRGQRSQREGCDWWKQTELTQRFPSRHHTQIRDGFCVVSLVLVFRMKILVDFHTWEFSSSLSHF